MPDSFTALRAKKTDLHKIKSTMVLVLDDLGDELKDRVSTLEDAYFDALGGAVICRSDVYELIDAVVKEVVTIVESEVDAGADTLDLDETQEATPDAVEGHGI